MSTNTEKILKYILENDGNTNLSTKPLLESGISPKQIAAGVSVLVRKGLIDKSPFITKNKQYLRDKSARTEEELKLLINDFLNLNTYSTKPLVSFLKSNKRELKLMNNKTGIYDNTVKSLWHFIHGDHVPICHACGNSVAFKNFKIGYRKFCSINCGSEYYWKNASTEDVQKRSDAARNTFKDKYDVEWYSMTDEYSDKIKKISLEKYKTSHYTKCKKVKEVTKNSMYNKYSGTGNGSPIIAEKIRQTMLKKYGVEYAWQIPEVQDKIQKARKMFKDYTMPSGKIVRIQGYEHYGIDELLLTYNESDLIISNKEISKYTGPIFYNDGRNRRYFPDIYIKSENKIIEIKSVFTFYGRWHKENLLKRDACIASGFDFDFMVYDRTGARISI